jgi:hypothetical protein
MIRMRRNTPTESIRRGPGSRHRPPDPSPRGAAVRPAARAPARLMTRRFPVLVSEERAVRGTRRVEPSPDVAQGRAWCCREVLHPPLGGPSAGLRMTPGWRGRPSLRGRVSWHVAPPRRGARTLPMTRAVLEMQRRNDAKSTARPVLINRGLVLHFAPLRLRAFTFEDHLVSSLEAPSLVGRTNAREAVPGGLGIFRSSIFNL